MRVEIENIESVHFAASGEVFPFFEIEVKTKQGSAFLRFRFSEYKKMENGGSLDALHFINYLQDIIESLKNSCVITGSLTNPDPIINEKDEEEGTQLQRDIGAPLIRL